MWLYYLIPVNIKMVVYVLGAELREQSELPCVLRLVAA